MINTITHLFFGKRFEFYSPYDLDEATDLLNRASQRHKRKPLSWKQTYQLLWIDVEETHKNTYHFKGNKEVGKNLYVVFTGELHSETSGITVTGMARPVFLTLIFPIAFLGIWLSLFMPLIDEPIFQIPLILGILTVTATYMAIVRSQNRMIDIIHEILSKSKKKPIESV